MPVAPSEQEPHAASNDVRRPPRASGPRFALRFEAGRGRLTLAKRHRFAFGFVEALELDLGRLRFPLDLSRGPARFRTRRTRVVHAELKVDVAMLVREWLEEPYGLTFLAPHPDGVLVALRDAFGTVATEVSFGVEGPDLAITMADARAATEGPAPPLARALVAARSLGLELDPQRGCLVVPRVLSALLREALVPFGWRVPDDRGAVPQLEMLSSDRVVLRTGEATPLPDVFAVSARLAPLVRALVDGDPARAEQIHQDFEERGILDPSTRAAAAGLGLGAGPLEGVSGIASRLREALARGDASVAAREAVALAASEPCDAVAVEGLSSAAELFVDESPDRATALLERAATRTPADARVALRLAEILARLGREDDLARVARMAVDAHEPGPARGEVARAAAVIAELSGPRALVAELFETAANALPHDPRSQEGLAEALAESGQSDRARTQFDRAARLYVADPEAAARAWSRGADVAEDAGDPKAAEERLAHATDAWPTAAGHARLARVRRALGRNAAARRADNALLESAQSFASLAPTHPAVDGLAAALDDALSAEESARARTFFDVLHRLAPERAAPFSARFDALDVERWLARPHDLLALEPTRALAVLGQAPDLDALLAAVSHQDDGLERLQSWFMHAEPGIVAARLASTLLSQKHVLTDPEVLLGLETLVDTPEDKAELALRACAGFEEAGRSADAARARGRAGAHRRDTAMLRAALTAAERAGAPDVALEIVELALSVVGKGPARRALEAVRERLSRE